MNKNPLFSAKPAFGTGFRNLHITSLSTFCAVIASVLLVALSPCLAVQNCTLAWDASSDSTIAGYRLRYGTTSGNPSQSIDAGKATNRTLSNLNDATTYYFTVVAYNSAGLESQPSNQVSYTTAGPGGSSEVVSIWKNTDVPQIADSGPDQPVELGVKFRSDVAGKISGIRFYKAVANTGRHVGNLWTNWGALLAAATFNSETASGWQQVNFATPVAINANTVYVASYHCDSGHYSSDFNYFSATAGEDNPPLHALPSTSSNSNGVYSYGANSAFPNQSWNSGNYWIDVVFQE